MGKIKDRLAGLDIWTKRVLTIAAVFGLLSGTVTGGWAAYSHFATNARVDVDIAAQVEALQVIKTETFEKLAKLETRIDKGDLKERMEYLRDQLRYCRSDYGVNYERASDRERAVCQDFEDELEDRRKEWDQYFK